MTDFQDSRFVAIHTGEILSWSNMDRGTGTADGDIRHSKVIQIADDWFGGDHGDGGY